MDTQTSSKRILLAHDPEKIGFILDALEGLDVVAATTLNEAEHLIFENGIKLFIAGIHFDDPRALQLITAIRLDSKHKSTPIIVVRLSQSEHTEMLRMTLETLIKLNIIDEFIEIDRHGDTQKRLFRKLVDKLLLGSAKKITR